MAATGANAEQDAKRRVALVIGNGAYKHAGPLANPRNDANAMIAALTRVGFDARSGLDLGRDAMEDRLGDFEATITGARTALLFYAGHGLQVKGQNYLVPVDADIRQEVHLKRRAFALDDILEIMARRAQNSLIFLDACRDNPFARSLLAGLPEAEQKRYMARSGLAEMKAWGGSFIAFATAPNNVALDGRGANSPFTEALLAHLETPGQSVSDMMIEVRRQVLKATSNRQEPWDQSALRERFCFKASTPPVEPLLSSPDSGAPSSLPEQQKTPPPSPPPHPWRYFVLGACLLVVAVTAMVASTPRAPRRCSMDEWSSIQTQINALRKFAGACNGTAAGALADERIDELEARDKTDEEQRRKRTGGEAAEAALRAAKEAQRAGKVRVTVTTGAGRNEERWLTPGNGKNETFQDCADCPEMVVVPAGNFDMGSPTDEPQRDDDEGPRHKVTIRNAFAVGQYAVTLAQFKAFVKDTGRKIDDGCYGWTGSEWKLDSAKSYLSPGFEQSDLNPVVCVNWDDAQAYVKWLSDKTGKKYRLPSEAEWEYVARAGTATPFWWGKSITPEQANYNGDYAYSGGGSKGENRQKTVPVKSFEPNPWGLYQVHGNVWGWTEDCWNKNYEGAPKDGSAWTIGDCGKHVLRGGSWLNDPRGLRAAFRFWWRSRVSGTGLRVARTF
jgi:formylglycine-generating enzyme required for sulfatase activity